MADELATRGADEDVSAAELALGVLDGEERAAALRRTLAEPGFAAEVERWRAYLAQLFDLWPEAEAPPGLIDRIDAAVAPGIGSGTPARPSRIPWPLIATISSALAAALLLVIALRPSPDTAPVPRPGPTAAASPAPAGPQPLLVAALGTTSPVAAVFEPRSGRLRVAAAPGVARGRVPQLWIIGSDGVPHALGLLAPTGNDLLLATADARRLVAGATLAVSAEPPGGSPLPTPTGPVVATGVLAAV